MPAFVFHKSSHSSGEPHAECIEVALNVPHVVAVRDSKTAGAFDPRGALDVVVTVSPAAWQSFVAAL